MSNTNDDSHKALKPAPKLGVKQPLRTNTTGYEITKPSTYDATSTTTSNGASTTGTTTSTSLKPNTDIKLNLSSTSYIPKNKLTTTDQQSTKPIEKPQTSIPTQMPVHNPPTMEYMYQNLYPHPVSTSMINNTYLNTAIPSMRMPYPPHYMMPQMNYMQPVINPMAQSYRPPFQRDTTIPKTTPLMTGTTSETSASVVKSLSDVRGAKPYIPKFKVNYFFNFRKTRLKQENKKRK